MSEKEEVEENGKEEESNEVEEEVEEEKEEVATKLEPKVEEKVKLATTVTSESNFATSAGTGLTVFSGTCPKCSARITSAVVKNGKFNCPTCKQDS